MLSNMSGLSQMSRRAFAAAVLLLLAPVAEADETVPGAAWEHATPAEAGWSEAGLAAVEDWSERMHATAQRKILIKLARGGA